MCVHYVHAHQHVCIHARAPNKRSEKQKNEINFSKLWECELRADAARCCCRCCRNCVICSPGNTHHVPPAAPAPRAERVFWLILPSPRPPSAPRARARTHPYIASRLAMSSSTSTSLAREYDFIFNALCACAMRLKSRNKQNAARAGRSMNVRPRFGHTRARTQCAPFAAARGGLAMGVDVRTQTKHCKTQWKFIIMFHFHLHNHPAHPHTPHPRSQPASQQTAAAVISRLWLDNSDFHERARCAVSHRRPQSTNPPTRDKYARRPLPTASQSPTARITVFRIIVIMIISAGARQRDSFIPGAVCVVCANRIHRYEGHRTQQHGYVYHDCVRIGLVFFFVRNRFCMIFCVAVPIVLYAKVERKSRIVYTMQYNADRLSHVQIYITLAACSSARRKTKSYISLSVRAVAVFPL